MSTIPQGLGLPGGNAADLVRAAEAQKGSRRRLGGFSLTTASGAERFIAPFLGLYLGWAVVRVPEVFPFLAVPRLPMMLMLVFMALLAFAVPVDGWRKIWAASLPLKCVAFLFALSLVTAPLGIYIMGSIAFIQERYVVAVVVFLACLVFLRDRGALRSTLRIYVVLTVIVAIYSLVTYDPTPSLVDYWGNPLDPEELNINKLRTGVGESLDPNDWGAVIATTVPLAVWLSIGSLGRRLFWGGCALVLCIALVPTASRGSLLGLGAGAMTLIAFGAVGWRRFVLLGGVAIGGLLFSLVASDGQLDRFLDISTDDYNVAGNDGRLYFWRQGMVWMIKRPWGYGIGNFSTYFGWLNGTERAAHSSWVQYGMELGVAGLSAFGLMCLYLWRQNRANRSTAVALQRRIGTPAVRERDLAGHVLAAMVGTLVTGSFLSNAYYPLMYMSLGIAAAVALGFPLTTDPAAGVTGADATPRPDDRQVVFRRREPRATK